MDRATALRTLGVGATPSSGEVEQAYRERATHLSTLWKSARSDAEREQLKARKKALDAARNAVLSVEHVGEDPLRASLLRDLPGGAGGRTNLGRSLPPSAAGGEGLRASELRDLPVPAGTRAGGSRAGSRPAAGAALAPGTLLLQRYELRQRIGAGGMGAVYAARDRQRGRDVALKVMHPSLARDPEAVERFAREAKIASELRHAGIVEVFGLERDGDLLFITMELLQGHTLRQEIEARKQAGRRFQVGEARGIGRQLCQALAFAHGRTVHRDVKPENVWVGADGRLKLMDFGLARVFRPSQLTMTGVAMGTAYYMAPEQLKGAKDIDHRADQYSTAVLLYELLTGELPTGRARSAKELRSDVPRGMSETLDRALSPKPEERFRDMRAFGHALAHGGGRQARWTRRVAAALVVLGVGGWALDRHVPGAHERLAGAWHWARGQFSHEPQAGDVASARAELARLRQAQEKESGLPVGTREALVAEFQTAWKQVGDADLEAERKAAAGDHAGAVAEFGRASAALARSAVLALQARAEAGERAWQTVERDEPATAGSVAADARAHAARAAQALGAGNLDEARRSYEAAMAAQRRAFEAGEVSGAGPLAKRLAEAQKAVKSLRADLGARLHTPAQEARKALEPEALRTSLANDRVALRAAHESVLKALRNTDFLAGAEQRLEAEEQALVRDAARLDDAAKQKAWDVVAVLAADASARAATLQQRLAEELRSPAKPRWPAPSVAVHALDMEALLKRLGLSGAPAAALAGQDLSLELLEEGERRLFLLVTTLPQGGRAEVVDSILGRWSPSGSAPAITLAPLICGRRLEAESLAEAPEWPDLRAEVDAPARRLRLHVEGGAAEATAVVLQRLPGFARGALARIDAALRAAEGGPEAAKRAVADAARARAERTSALERAGDADLARAMREAVLAVRALRDAERLEQAWGQGRWGQGFATKAREGADRARAALEDRRADEAFQELAPLLTSVGELPGGAPAAPGADDDPVALVGEWRPEKGGISPRLLPEALRGRLSTTIELSADGTYLFRAQALGQSVLEAGEWRRGAPGGLDLTLTAVVADRRLLAAPEPWVRLLRLDDPGNRRFSLDEEGPPLPWVARLTEALKRADLGQLVLESPTPLQLLGGPGVARGARVRVEGRLEGVVATSFEVFVARRPGGGAAAGDPPPGAQRTVLESKAGQFLEDVALPAGDGVWSVWVVATTALERRLVVRRDVEVDTTPPEVEVKWPVESWWPVESSAVQVSGTVRDEHAVTVSLVVGVAKSENASVLANVENGKGAWEGRASVGEGDWSVLRVEARDAAGNVARSSTRCVTTYAPWRAHVRDVELALDWQGGRPGRNADYARARASLESAIRVGLPNISDPRDKRPDAMDPLMRRAALGTPEVGVVRPLLWSVGRRDPITWSILDIEGWFRSVREGQRLFVSIDGQDEEEVAPKSRAQFDQETAALKQAWRSLRKGLFEDGSFLVAFGADRGESLARLGTGSHEAILLVRDGEGAREILRVPFEIVGPGGHLAPTPPAVGEQRARFAEQVHDDWIALQSAWEGRVGQWNRFRTDEEVRRNVFQQLWRPHVIPGGGDRPGAPAPAPPAPAAPPAPQPGGK